MPSNANVKSVVNLFPDEASSVENTDAYFSVGLHPWYIDDRAPELLKIVSEVVSLPNVVFVGETGLDKNAQANMKEQVAVFEAQLLIARQVRKPLIIHCVRAYQEVLAFKKNYPDVAFIFHAFRGKPELAKQLLNSGCYLSVGDKAAFAPETIKYIPLESLFIETDESTVAINETYQKIAALKSITEFELIDGCWANFDKLTTLRQ